MVLLTAEPAIGVSWSGGDVVVTSASRVVVFAQEASGAWAPARRWAAPGGSAFAAAAVVQRRARCVVCATDAGSVVWAPLGAEVAWAEVAAARGACVGLFAPRRLEDAAARWPTGASSDSGPARAAPWPSASRGARPCPGPAPRGARHSAPDAVRGGSPGVAAAAARAGGRPAGRARRARRPRRRRAVLRRRRRRRRAAPPPGASARSGAGRRGRAPPAAAPPAAAAEERSFALAAPAAGAAAAAR
ncbi:hypothetical protein JL722_11078 [Aureococcus anophagefferens]|nr:hypothetical protein JL722_11078 [Aureococcus anophagefferens]